MKKIIFVLVTCFIAMISLSAQSVNGVSLKDLNADYIEVWTDSKPLTNKVFFELDFGQERRGMSNDDTRLKDSSGKNMTFNSGIDGLNFMIKNGYELVQAKTFTISSTQSGTSYLLRKKNK